MWLTGKQTHPYTHTHAVKEHSRKSLPAHAHKHTPFVCQQHLHTVPSKWHVTVWSVSSWKTEQRLCLKTTIRKREGLHIAGTTAPVLYYTKSTWTKGATNQEGGWCGLGCTTSAAWEKKQCDLINILLLGGRRRWQKKKKKLGGDLVPQVTHRDIYPSGT